MKTLLLFLLSALTVLGQSVELRSVTILGGVEIGQAAVVPEQAPYWPLGVSTNSKFIVDANSSPVFLVGDGGWNCIVTLTTNEAAWYFSNRSNLGVNFVIARLIDRMYQKKVTSLYGVIPPKNRAGDFPFTNGTGFTYDLNSPNPAYFNHASNVVKIARAYGITMFLCPWYLGSADNLTNGWFADIESNSTANCEYYAKWLGTNFQNLDNIVWVAFGDRSNNIPNQQAMWAALKAVDSNHIWTAHISAADSIWAATNSLLDLEGIYNSHSADLPYRVSIAYTNSPTRPVMLLDTGYENEGYEEFVQRKQTWWALSSGGHNGFLQGQAPIWWFGSQSGLNWSNALATPGRTQAVNAIFTMTNRTWWTLQPDNSKTIATGRGTLRTTNWVSASFSSQSNWGFAYFPPNATSLTMTMSYFVPAGTNIVASWISPASGQTNSSTTNAASGSVEFTAPTTTDDWVLLFDPEGGI